MAVEPLWRPHPHRGSDLERASVPVTALAAAVPLGFLAAPASVTADQGSITTEADLTSLTLTVTVGASRRLRVRGVCHFTSSVVNDEADLIVTEDGTDIMERVDTMTIAGRFVPLEVEATSAPAAGSHTYKLRMKRSAGTGTITMRAGATFPAFLTVEDVGAA